MGCQRKEEPLAFLEVAQNAIKIAAHVVSSMGGATSRRLSFGPLCTVQCSLWRKEIGAARSGNSCSVVFRSFGLFSVRLQKKGEQRRGPMVQEG